MRRNPTFLGGGRHNHPASGDSAPPRGAVASHRIILRRLLIITAVTVAGLGLAVPPASATVHEIGEPDPDFAAFANCPNVDG